MKRITIDVIDNGYLVTNDENHTRRGYQVDAQNNQIPLMLNQILSALQEKGYRVVEATAAAKLAIKEECTHG